jgi:hypothetical protein
MKKRCGGPRLLPPGEEPVPQVRELGMRVKTGVDDEKVRSHSGKPNKSISYGHASGIPPSLTYLHYIFFLSIKINVLEFIHIFTFFQFIFLALVYSYRKLRNVRRGNYDGGNKENYVVVKRKS